ncbi:hypothetical protein C6495_06125 [Candidatus Poribacteria bacterium]|nr:MAG: hypothetical protein C6495_06125 [Candidatus Poribacteria bacterium]
MSTFFLAKNSQNVHDRFDFSKFRFFCQHFSEKISKKVIFCDISINYSKNREKCQPFFLIFRFARD